MKRTIRYALVGLCLLTLTAAAAAETTCGTVVDHLGNPLAGVTLSTADGKSTQTDDQGRFEIVGTSGDQMLTVSHVGFVTRSDLLARSGHSKTIMLSRSMTKLDDIQVTGSRYEKSAYKLTQPISSTSGLEIKKEGHNLVSDAIRTFPGVDMNDAGPFRARPVIRGLYGTRILVLVDGERLNDQRDISSFAGVSMSLVDVNEIERIEVVNGPASVLYGSDAMAGVVNILTHKRGFADQLTPTASFSSQYSTADQQHANRVDLGFKSPRWSGSFGFQYREASKDFQPSDGWNAEKQFGAFRPEFYDSLNAATGRNFSNDRLANTRARVNNYDFNLAYRLDERYRLDLDGGIFRGSDIGYPGVPNDSTPFWFFYPNHDRDNVSLTLTGNSLSDRVTRLQLKVYYQKIEKDFLTDFLNGIVVAAGPGMFITPLDVLNHTEVSKYGVNFQELYNLGDSAVVTLGFDFLREEITGQSVSRTKYEGMGPLPFVETEEYSPVPDNRWNELGIYLSSDFDYRKFRFTLGGRLDNYWIKTDATEGYQDDSDQQLPTADDRYTAITGSLGAVYPLTATVNLVGNLGSAFRVPNVVERFYFGSASNRETRPNQDIDPERSVSVDAGVKAIHENIAYSITGFYSDYQDFTQLIKFDSLAGHAPGAFDPLWRYENIEDVVIYGVEAVIEGSVPNGLYGSMSMSYQHGQNETADQPLFVSPFKIIVTAGYRYPKHGLFGELSVRRVEDQTRVPHVTYLDDIASQGFTTLGLTVGAELFERVRLSVAVKNLLDEAYAEPFNARNPDNPVPEPGRNVTFSVSSQI